MTVLVLMAERPEEAAAATIASVTWTQMVARDALLLGALHTKAVRLTLTVPVMSSATFSAETNAIPVLVVLAHTLRRLNERLSGIWLRCSGGRGQGRGDLRIEWYRERS